jgi:hypothetical protein
MAAGSRLQDAGVQTIAAALGRSQRADPVVPGTGGPAGNARLTAWTGLLLLVLFLAELVTLLDVRGLISWHIAIGALLIPPALLKTATTGWRMVRYYLGERDYRAAGPPPMLLRLLGPLVVLSTLAVLGTGLALVFVGAQTSRETLVSVLGQRVDTLTLHQGSFAVWAVATGLHTLSRLLPAVRTVALRSSRAGALPGRRLRVTVLGLVALLAAVSTFLVLSASGDWRQGGGFEHRAPGSVGEDH